MSKKFRVIVADPPWSFGDLLRMSKVKRGAKSQYSTMTMSKIEQMPVQATCHPDGAVLCLWVPGSLLREGLDVMKAWGFSHKQTYVWVKIKKHAPYKRYAHSPPQDQLAFGMGRLFRQTHELCLVGISSSKIYKQLKNKSQRSVSFGENLKHSSKPDDLQKSLEVMFPKARKLELFARRIRPGWTCLGNEVCNGEDIYVSLSKL
jgi:N6-adenosine-specific RNA methylase IME4